jgi:ankyrin repeat protein
MLAAECGHRDTIEVLLGAGADVYLRDDFGRSVTMHAVEGMSTLTQEISPVVRRERLEIYNDVVKLLGSNIDSN